MTVHSPTPPAPGLDAKVRLSAYVERSLTATVDRFTQPEARDQIDDAVARAMPAHLQVELELGAPHWESGAHVHVRLGWRVTGRSGRSAAGTGSISMLVVRTGAEPVTELLVDLPVTPETRRAVVAAARRALDDFTHQLEATAA